MEMKVRYGKVIRSISAVSSTGIEFVPLAKTRKRRAIHGEASQPSAVTTTTVANSAPAMWSMKSCTAASSPFSRSSDSTGTNADANEPSAKMRRR